MDCGEKRLAIIASDRQKKIHIIRIPRVVEDKGGGGALDEDTQPNFKKKNE